MRDETPTDGADRSRRRYWRSLERLADSPAVTATPEFPDGADLPPTALDRRTMLGLMGASFSLAGLQGCRRPVEHIVPFVDAPERRIPGIPERYATTLRRGAEAVGVVVESHDGRPTKIEGNELHPSSGGAASLWMQAEILALYDPDRLRRPLRRPRAGAADPAAAATEATASGAPEGGEAGAHAAAPEADGSGFGGADPAATWDDFAAWWAEHAGALDADGGRGLAVLAAGSPSRTRTRLREAFLARFPAARWVRWDAVSDDASLAGTAAAAGRPLRPVHRLERARTIVALDADLFQTETDALRAARGFAAARRPEGEEMCRLYAVEPSYTITGASADHRIRLQRRQIPAFAAALAAALGVGRANAEALPEEARRRVAALAEDLRAAGPRALLVAGRSQPAAVHDLVLRIHAALGAIGTTVEYHEPVEEPGGAAALAELAAELGSGAVRTLVVLGGNPALDAPADLDLGGRIGAVPHVVRFSSRDDETARLATWVLPESHPLEAWDDARAVDGTLSLVQPLIAPLHDTRSEVELLALLATGEASSGHDLVRETFAAGGPVDEGAWRRALHDGVIEGSTAAPAAVSATGSAPEIPAGEQPGLELTFHPCAKVFDGRGANNGWLQELPDPITKVTWDNAALLSPRTAGDLGLVTGQTVTLRLGDRSVDAALFVLPGQADGSVAVTLGYGRTGAGRVGDGVGFDAYRLRGSATLHTAGDLEVTPSGGSHELVQTQEHWSMEGRDLVREGTLARFREEPGFLGHDHEPEHSHQLFGDHSYEESPQWGMAIDLTSCIGCNACVVACQAENNIPVVGPAQVAAGREMHWLRIDRYFADEPDDPEVVFQPIPCMHCENAPCEQVCPVAATVHDAEGLNAMVYNRCIGTRYCSNNCPYKVRRFNFFNFTKDTPELVAMAMNPDVTVRSRGVMEKCTYCVQRISEAKIDAKRAGRALVDGDVRTACQQTCPTDAISFGDVRDAASEVSLRKAGPRDYTLLSELNNRPRTTYQARIRNPNPRWDEA